MKWIILFLLVSCNQSELENRVMLLEAKIKSMEHQQELKKGGFYKDGIVVKVIENSCSTVEKCKSCCTTTYVDLKLEDINYFSLQSLKIGNYRDCMKECKE